MGIYYVIRKLSQGAIDKKHEKRKIIFMAHIKDSLTYTGAAELVGVTEGTIRAAVRRGELPVEASNDGRVSLIPRAQVVAWGKHRPKRGRPPKA